MNALRNFLTGIILLLVIFSLGTVLFSAIEKVPLFDSFYYVLMTITTVGSNIYPQTTSGKILTMFLLFFGIGTVLYIATFLTRMLIEGESIKILTDIRRRIVKMKKMKNHVIVCGYGRTGRHVVSELKQKGLKYVVIEKDSEKCQQLLEKKENLIQGDAEDSEILMQADILEAGCLVATLTNDADNIYIVMTAKELNPNLTIAARAQEEIAVERLKRVGASIVVQPQIEGGKQLVNAISECRVEGK